MAAQSSGLGYARSILYTKHTMELLGACLHEWPQPMRDQTLFDRIDLHLIRVLHTVLIERSVSRAALRLGMHQPAVSASLRRLRELAGDPLLVRSGTDAAHRGWAAHDAACCRYLAGGRRSVQ